VGAQTVYGQLQHWAQVILVLQGPSRHTAHLCSAHPWTHCLVSVMPDVSAGCLDVTWHHMILMLPSAT
jgi:hypothetical protein